MHKVPTLSQVKAIHYKIIREQGQIYIPLPKTKEVSIESILIGVNQVVFGEVLYKTLCDKAVYILDNIQASQAFPDGNKRVALATFEFFLFINGSSLYNVSQTEKKRFMLNLARHRVSREYAIECCIKGLKR